MTRRKTKKTPGVCLDSKKTLKSYKRNPIDSAPAKIIEIALETGLKVFYILLKNLLEWGHKMFHKFVKTRLLKEPESIYLLITRENINI